MKGHFRDRFLRLLPISLAVMLVTLPLARVLGFSASAGAAMGGAIVGVIASRVLKNQRLESN